MMISYQKILVLMGGSTVVISGIIYYIFNRIADKLSIRWKASAEVNLAKVSSELSKNNGTLNSLLGLYANNYHQGHDKRIKAIEILWRQLIKFKGIIPSQAHIIYNAFNEQLMDDYFTRVTDNEFYLHERRSLLDINKDTHLSTHLHYISDIELERPFIGENIWYYYKVYEIFITRMALWIFDGRDSRDIKPWQHDAALRDVLSKTLTPDELNFLYGSEYNSLKLALDFFDKKLLREINKVLSGDSFSETAIESVKRFQSKLIPSI